MGDNPLSSLGRDILEEIVLRVEDARERVKFSGGVSKEIKRMLWQGSREMPLELYRGATVVVVKERDMDTLSSRICVSGKIVVQGPRESSTSLSFSKNNNSRLLFGQVDDAREGMGLDLACSGFDLDDCEYTRLMSRILGYCCYNSNSDTEKNHACGVPVSRMTMHHVTCGQSGYKVLRHAAFRQLRTLHLKNVSVVLSHQDSLCHLERLEELLIQNAFVSIVPRADGEERHMSLCCLPPNLKRIEMTSSTCSLSIYEWIRFCGTTLAHSCEELVLDDVGCCHTAFCHGEHVYSGSLDLSHCENLKRIKIGSSHCFQNRGSMPCMPHGITLVLGNDTVQSVDIDEQATHGVTWIMHHRGSCGSLRELKIKGSDWKRRFHVDHFIELRLPQLHVLDVDQPACLQVLEGIVDQSFCRDSLKRVIVRILGVLENRGVLCILNTAVEFARECPHIQLIFSDSSSDDH